ncbi:AlbA family DNA-binding domain-containing protein [Streptomyces phaeochromogenes]|uniref:AlbA family DNA-binding domain-containing protein n=1 Tax=Streptomyces phaeochromogenes TaxID=1923 RepID=UPI0033CDA6A3
MFDARLRTLLGTAPGAATYAQYLTLVRNPSAAESTDVDYKGKQYERKPEWQAELAKDVAALANASGGTLILGLEEDRATSVPVGANPEPLTDQLRKNYREALVWRLDPLVECDIHFIPQDPSASSPHGLVVISVPPSARGPHAVTGFKDARDHTLRFPYRNDNNTAYMNLTQVKRAIAASTSLAAGRREILEANHEAIATDGRARPGPRIALTLVPDLPGAFPIDSATFHAFRRELSQAEMPFYGRDVFLSFGVGPRRFIASTGESRSRHVAHFHADGTAAWVTEGPLVGAFGGGDEALPNLAQSWHSDHVVMNVLAILQYLTRHSATRAGASGTATARLTLSVGSRACGLASDRGSTAHIVFSSTEQQLAVGQTGLLLGAADDASLLVQAAASLLADCYQHFGVVEAEQLTHDGKINLPGWGRRSHDTISEWAKVAGVDIQTDP